MSTPPPIPPAVLDYATPVGADVSNNSAYRVQDGLIVGPTFIVLPARCVVCNGEQYKRLEKTLWWHSPAWFFLVLVSIWIYVIVALCIRKRGIVHYGECMEHNRKRRRFAMLSFLIAIGGIVAAIVIGVMASDRVIDQDFLPLGIIAGILIVLGAIILGAIKGGAPIKPKFIDKTTMRLKGAGQPFLSSL